jgi:hypothetical protein
MINKKWERIHKCMLNLKRKTGTKEIFPPIEAPNSQGMVKGQWHRGCPEVSNPSPNPPSVEKALGTGRSDLYGKKPPTSILGSESWGEKIRNKKRLWAFKPRNLCFKKNEFGLTNRSPPKIPSKEEELRKSRYCILPF